MAPAASSEALHLPRQVCRCWHSTSRDRDGLKLAWPREGWVLIVVVMLLCLEGSLEGSQSIVSSGLSSVVLHLPLVRSAAEPLRHLFWNWQECDPSVSIQLSLQNTILFIQDTFINYRKSVNNMMLITLLS